MLSMPLSFLLAALSFTPFLDESALRRVREILSVKKSETNLERAEQEYQRLVAPQTLRDLLAVYDPANRARIAVTYPEFSAEGGRPGGDLGYGLHVMKRLRLGEKLIDVNEHWAEDRATGGLFAPDEIRIKTRAFVGERHVPGSHELYLYDVIRLAWGPDAQTARLCRRTRYTWDAQGARNRTKTMRVPASSPYSCQACHVAGAKFFASFAQPGEARDYEVIVGEGFTKLPLAETFGMRDYLARLRGRDPVLLAHARATLSDPRARMMPEAVADAIRRALGGREEECWLPSDEPSEVADESRQGAYRRGGESYLDAIENVIPGKYETWRPRTLVP